MQLLPSLLLLIPVISAHSTFFRTPVVPVVYSHKTFYPKPVIAKPLHRSNTESLVTKYKKAEAAGNIRVTSNTGSLTTKYKTYKTSNTQSFGQSLGLSGSDDIVKDTRAQAESLKDELRSIASNPRASQILNKVFSDRNNVCIKSMDDAIEAIETSTKLFENAGSEIKQLVDLVDVFNGNIETPKAVRETAKILRILDVLIPKITPDSNSKCSPSSSNVFGSLSSLADLVNELASRDDIYFSIHKKQTLKSAAKTVTTVTDFLSKLERDFSRFDQFCSRDKDYSLELISALSDMMDNLAGLYKSLDGHSAAFELRKQGDFTKKMVANIEKLEHLDMITLDCNKQGSSGKIADALEDLAGIIEEVGLESLCSQLDLECTF